jgi:hypothetical protein
VASRKSGDVVAEESITLTVPVSVIHEAIAALKARTIEQHWTARQGGRNEKYWRRNADRAERAAEWLRKELIENGIRPRKHNRDPG